MNVAILLKISDGDTEFTKIFSISESEWLSEMYKIQNYEHDEPKHYVNLIKKHLHDDKYILLFRLVSSLYHIYGIRYTTTIIDGLYITLINNLSSDVNVGLFELLNFDIKEQILLN